MYNVYCSTCDGPSHRSWTAAAFSKLAWPQPVLSPAQLASKTADSTVD